MLYEHTTIDEDDQGNTPFLCFMPDELMVHHPPDTVRTDSEYHGLTGQFIIFDLQYRSELLCCL